MLSDPDPREYGELSSEPPSDRYDWMRWGGRLYLAVAALILLIVAITVSGCSSVRCDLLGSDSLRRQCEDQAFAVTIYRVPTWCPGCKNDFRTLLEE